MELQDIKFKRNKQLMVKMLMLADIGLKTVRLYHFGINKMNIQKRNKCIIGLSNVLESHQKLQLPPFPENDDFCDWLVEFIEIDAYYFGLASSVIAGTEVVVNFEYFVNSKIKLNMLKDCNDDIEVYQLSCKYMNSLEKIICFLKAIFVNEKYESD